MQLFPHSKTCIRLNGYKVRLRNSNLNRIYDTAMLNRFKSNSYNMNIHICKLVSIVDCTFKALTISTFK